MENRFEQGYCLPLLVVVVVIHQWCDLLRFVQRLLLLPLQLRPSGVRALNAIVDWRISVKDDVRIALSVERDFVA